MDMWSRMMRKIMVWGFNYDKAVADGAIHLKISEVELFELAYRGWFKQETDPTEIQRHYHLFQTQGSLPYWLKHYVRQLDARTHYMTEQCSQRRLFCWSWLSRLVILMVLPGSYGFLKQMLVGQKFSLYC
jgi:hypothetical protein